MSPLPVTPYSPAAWSWRATAPRSVSPAACPRGQGSLRWKGAGEGLFPWERGIPHTHPCPPHFIPQLTTEGGPRPTRPSYAVPAACRFLQARFCIALILSLLEKGKDLLSSLVFSSLNMNYRFSVSLKKLFFFFCFCIYSVIWEIFDIFTV